MKTALLCVLVASVTPMAVAEPPVQPFNGKDTSNWAVLPGKGESRWEAVGDVTPDPRNPGALERMEGEGVLANLATRHGDSLDIHTKQKFGSCRIELDVLIPPGSNSGIYVMGEYEVQVFDSHGKPEEKLGPGDMGAIYGAAVPKVNACNPPGDWNHFVIEWEAPKFDAQGRKTANGRFLKVEVNGKVLHENVGMPGPTPGGVTGKEAPAGPLMLQGNHGAAAFQNIRITPRRAESSPGSVSKAADRSTIRKDIRVFAAFLSHAPDPQNRPRRCRHVRR